MTFEEHGGASELVRLRTWPRTWLRTWPGCSSARVVVSLLFAVLFRLHSSSTLVDGSPGGRMRTNCPSFTRCRAAGAMQEWGAAPTATLPAALVPTAEMGALG